MPEDTGRINEAMRMIRWRMANEKTSFREVMQVIPRWLIWLVVGLFLAAHAITQVVIVRVPDAQSAFGLQANPPLRALAMAGAVTAASVFVAGYIFLLAYINRDAKRRGMRYVLWTIIAVVVPYLIGAIAYFLVREPLLYACPQCRSIVSARFNYCPNCKFNLRPTCPQCKREVRIEDHFCPNCAYDLTAKPAVAGT